MQSINKLTDTGLPTRKTKSLRNYAPIYYITRPKKYGVLNNLWAINLTESWRRAYIHSVSKFPLQTLRACSGDQEG